MHDLVIHAISIFLSFFAIMNPVANTAVFIGLTDKYDKPQQRIIAKKALLTSFFIIVIFSLLGKTLFELFGITLPALRITGGILVFIIGFHMINGKASSLHENTHQEDIDIAISPLAVPILAGPGTIATAMNYAATGSWSEILITIATFASLCLITFSCFIFAKRISHAIGQSGMVIITRLMGLILAVMGTQLVIEGIKEAFVV